jgi:sulfide:quinone oxidoreductase
VSLRVFRGQAFLDAKLSGRNNMSTTAIAKFDVVIVGGGAAGIGSAASLLKRQSNLRIAIIEPADKHYYQPAWTLVGGGAFNVNDTVRPMASCMPRGVEWIQAAATGFQPDSNQVELDNGSRVAYQQLIVCPGLKLNWAGIEGLTETLGKNGVTSNYRFDLAPYTWQLVQNLKGGTAIFSQPPMPIKCAGAPQKALYLSCDYWLKSGVLNNIKVEFNSAGAVLFGVAAFVPPLMKYIERYNAQLVFNSTLKSVNGATKTARFDIKDAEGNVQTVEKSFDLLHVVPPQCAPDFLRNSPLADAAGWVEVDQYTLQHPRFANVFGLGDACSTPNAKTAAAARKQIVVVAENLISLRNGQPVATRYDGYGSCPLTVERGKIILAEFGYGGKLLPTFPLDPTIPRASAWWLKATALPWIYWNAMLKGREWLAKCVQN